MYNFKEKHSVVFRQGVVREISVFLAFFLSGERVKGLGESYESTKYRPILSARREKRDEYI